MVEREALDAREFHKRRLQGLRLQERGEICDWNDENEETNVRAMWPRKTD